MLLDCNEKFPFDLATILCSATDLRNFSGKTKPSANVKPNKRARSPVNAVPRKRTNVQRGTTASGQSRALQPGG